MTAPRSTVVSVFGAVPEGEMACAQLRAAGIEGRLEGAQTVGVLPLHSLALGGIRLVVAASDGDRAREVLGILGKGSPDEETEPEGMALLREGDAWMRRAAFSAGFGTIVPVVMTAYSIGILATQSRRPMTDRGRRLRAVAVVFNVAAVAVAACLLWIRALPQAPL